ncbi:MAG TPA: hypothetical protein VG406_00175 [Isosphaeraceae bacterium]|jgi:hypothetical protein|nr:hypothetical protein [Isosphaeraceae bacterium]
MTQLAVVGVATKHVHLILVVGFPGHPSPSLCSWHPLKLTVPESVQSTVVQALAHPVMALVW